MKRGKTGEPGKLGRAEALGAIVVVSLYISSMLASFNVDPQLFRTQLLYFTIITFCLVAMILAFDKLTLECVRISKYVVAGCVISAVAMFALVNFIVVNPSILQIAALSSITPTVGLAVYQVMFVGVGEGILHFFLIRLSYSAVKNWGIAILVGSGILGAMHIFAVGTIPLSLVFLGLIFVVMAGLAMVPTLLDPDPKRKVVLSLIVASVVHMIYNVTLILMPKAVKAAAAAAVAVAGV